MNDDEEDAGGVEQVFIVAGADVMREPTNLELAEIVSIYASQTQILLMLDRATHDIMEDDDRKAELLVALEQNANTTQNWWLSLVKDDLFASDDEEDENGE